MHPVTATAANSTSFFEGLGESFAQACRRVRLTTHRLEVAGRGVRLELAGQELARLVLPALAHLLTERSDAAPSLTVCAWDATSSGVSAPRPPFGTAAHRNRGDLVPPAGEKLRLAFPLDSGVLECSLPGTGRAYAWLRDRHTFGPAQQAVPFRSVFGWWGEEVGAHMVHAASVASDLGGALLTAPGGSGKSTTAVECLQAGLQYAGDDSVLLERSATGWIASSLFSTARLGQSQLAEYPGLERFVDERQDKATLLLAPTHQGSLARRLPVHVVLVPRVSARGQTSLQRLSGAATLRAIAPSSVFMVAGSTSSALQQLGRLAEEVPAYELELGPHAPDNVAAVRAAIARHGRTS